MEAVKTKTGEEVVARRGLGKGWKFENARTHGRRFLRHEATGLQRRVLFVKRRDLRWRLKERHVFYRTLGSPSEPRSIFYVA